MAGDGFQYRLKFRSVAIDASFPVCQCSPSCVAIVKMAGRKYARGHAPSSRTNKPEIIAKISQSLLGRKRGTESEETRRRKSVSIRSSERAKRAQEASRGRKLTEAQRQERRDSWVMTPARAAAMKAIGDARRGTQLPGEQKEKIREARARQVLPFRDTKPEIEVQRYLSSLSLDFKKHWPIPGSKHQYDVLIPRLKVAIEVDGCYWHKCFRCFPDVNYDALQVTIERDESINLHAQHSGWKMVRIWEHDIKARDFSVISGNIKVEASTVCQ